MIDPPSNMKWPQDFTKSGYYYTGKLPLFLVKSIFVINVPNQDESTRRSQCDSTTPSNYITKKTYLLKKRPGILMDDDVILCVYALSQTSRHDWRTMWIWNADSESMKSEVYKKNKLDTKDKQIRYNADMLRKYFPSNMTYPFVTKPVNYYYHHSGDNLHVYPGFLELHSHFTRDRNQIQEVNLPIHPTTGSASSFTGYCYGKATQIFVIHLKNNRIHKIPQQMFLEIPPYLPGRSNEHVHLPPDTQMDLVGMEYYAERATTLNALVRVPHGVYKLNIGFAAPSEERQLRERIKVNAKQALQCFSDRELLELDTIEEIKHDFIDAILDKLEKTLWKIVMYPINQTKDAARSLIGMASSKISFTMFCRLFFAYYTSGGNLIHMIIGYMTTYFLEAFLGIFH